MRVDATPEHLKQLIEYRPDTGELIWNPRVPSDFNARNSDAACDAFNRRRAGQIAGQVNLKGYVVPIPARSAEYAVANGLSDADADTVEAVLLFIQDREQEFIEILGKRNKK